MMMSQPRSFAGTRGKLLRDLPLAKYTTWRCGGRADVAFLPADRDDLAAFVTQLPPGMPLTVIGLGSNILVRDGSVHPIDWESAALAAGEIDLVALIDGWPDDVVERALAAYVDARWGGQAPGDFASLCDAARLYVGLRWLGDRPYWTNLDTSDYDFRALCATGRRLGLIA